MRGALDEKVKEVYRFYTVPASNTAVGHIILENGVNTTKKAAAKKAAPKKKAKAMRPHEDLRFGQSTLARSISVRSFNQDVEITSLVGGNQDKTTEIAKKYGIACSPAICRKASKHADAVILTTPTKCTSARASR